MRVERQEELEAALDRLGDGLGGLVLISGESGIGKTTLLQQMVHAARQSDYQVLSGRGEEMERIRPFRPLIDALRSHPLTHALAAELSSGAMVPADRLITEAAFVAADHLAASLDVLAATRPVLLVLDDLQWADDLTMRTMVGLLQRLRGSAVLIVLAARKLERVGALVEQADVSMRLERLQRDEVRDWLTARAGAPPDDELAHALDGCAGLPLNLARVLRNTGITLRDGQATMARQADPDLSAETRSALRIASLLGLRFGIGELSELLGRTVADTLLALTPALDCGLLDDDGDALRFAHPSDRAAFELEVPASARPALHLQIAEVIEGHGGDIGRILAHLIASGPLPLDRSMGAVAVARQQATLAPGPAAGLFTAALAVVSDAGERDRLNADLAEALFRSGEHDAAARHVTSVLPGCTDLDAGLRLRTVRYVDLDRTGRGEERLALVDAELVVASGPLRRWLLAKQGNALLALGRIQEAEVAASEACALSRESGDAVVEIHGQLTLGWTAAAQGHTELAISACQRAAQVEQTLGGRIDQYEMYLGTVLSEADRFAEAAAIIHTGQVRDLGRGDVETLSHYQWVLAGMALFADELDSAEIEARTGIDLAEENANAVGLLLGHALLALALLHRGDLEGARTAGKAGDEQLQTGGPGPGIDFHFWVSALIAEADHDEAGALRLLRIWWDFLGETRYFLSWRGICPDLVRLALHQSEIDLATAVTAAAVEGARRAGPGVPSAEAAALRCRAWLTHDPSLAEQAVQLLAASPRRLDQRLARADVVALSASRSVVPMSASRVPAIRRAPDELTPAEMRIVREVARGVSNREIADSLLLSRHTVESHLKRIFVKLDVRSRSALSALAVRSGWVSEPTNVA